MHEVVNGANGSVTWCGGLGCDECERRKAQTAYWMAYPINSTVVIPMTYPTTRTFGTPTGAFPMVWS